MAKAPPLRSLAALAARSQRAVAATVNHQPVAPQLPTLVAVPPTGDDWLTEAKLDGYRLLATLRDDSVRVWSRHGVDWTDRLSTVSRQLAKLPCRSAIVDGELVAGGGLQTDFNLLQDAISTRSTDTLTYVAFDLLNVDDVDLRRVALVERRDLLRKLLKAPIARIALSTHVVGRSAEALAVSRAARYEGIVCKRADSYYTGGRTRDWLKVRNHASEDLAVVGFLPSRNQEGAAHLLLARPVEEGRWAYAGRVRPSRAVDADLGALLGPPYCSAAPVGIDRTQLKVLADAVWFEPRFVVEIDQRAIGRTSQFRQPKIRAVRLDKLPADLWI